MGRAPKEQCADDRNMSQNITFYLWNIYDVKLCPWLQCLTIFFKVTCKLCMWKNDLMEESCVMHNMHKIKTEAPRDSLSIKKL